MNQRYLSLLQQSKNIPISEILDYFKVKYDKSFSYLISCPIPAHIHQSGTPSFKVYKDTNSFYCFGCKAAGGPVQLVQHMLGVKTLEEALDFLAEHFNLETKSVARTFLSITNKIKSKPISISRETIVRATYSKFIALSDSIRRIKLKCFDDSFRKHQLMLIMSRLHYQQVLFINNIIDRDTFESNCNSMLNYLEKLNLECRQKEYVIDAESLLELTTKL